MDYNAYLTIIREESARLLDACATVGPDVPVPSCLAWNASDLLWHIADVQYFWTRVLSGVSGEKVVDPDRPDDRAALRGFAERSGAEMVAAFAQGDPAASCWSWNPRGGSFAWLARRQAHEALIHRVDAEQTAGMEVRVPSVDLAVDGVDDVLIDVMDNGSGADAFVPDGARVRIACSDASATWMVELGQVPGRVSESGTAPMKGAAAVHGEVVTGGAQTTPVGLAIRGSAWDLDCWLWGRRDVDMLELIGDVALAARVRRLMTDREW